MRHAAIGSTILSFNSLRSTNRFATKLLSKTCPRPGTVISAVNQSAGEGQYGREWFGSKGKNLYSSVILLPKIPPSQQFLINAFVSLAVRDAISVLIRRNATIKWPNDIYVGDRKVAGILIQNTISANAIQSTVAGIGINVNETNFPDSLSTATSLSLECGGFIALHSVFTQLLEELNEWQKRAVTLPLATLRRHYEKHLYKIERTVGFINLSNQEEFEGRIKGVDDYGRLLVQVGNQSKTFMHGEIKQIIE